MELTKTVAIKKKWLCKLTMLKKLLQKNNKRGTVLIIIFSLMLFTNCKSELQSFNDTVLEFANNDKRIDKNEFEILLEVISTSDERGFAQFKNENGTIENTRIVSYLLKYCSAKNIDLTESDIWQAESKEQHKKFNINVYLENSASMDAYVRGFTEFETAIYNLLGDFKISKICDSLKIRCI